MEQFDFEDEINYNEMLKDVLNGDLNPYLLNMSLNQSEENVNKILTEIINEIWNEKRIELVMNVKKNKITLEGLNNIINLIFNNLSSLKDVLTVVNLDGINKATADSFYETIYIDPVINQFIITKWSNNNDDIFYNVLDKVITNSKKLENHFIKDVIKVYQNKIKYIDNSHDQILKKTKVNHIVFSFTHLLDNINIYRQLELKLSRPDMKISNLLNIKNQFKEIIQTNIIELLSIASDNSNLLEFVIYHKIYEFITLDINKIFNEFIINKIVKIFDNKSDNKNLYQILLTFHNKLNFNNDLLFSDKDLIPILDLFNHFIKIKHPLIDDFNIEKLYSSFENKEEFLIKFHQYQLHRIFKNNNNIDFEIKLLETFLNPLVSKFISRLKNIKDSIKYNSLIFNYQNWDSNNVVYKYPQLFNHLPIKYQLFHLENPNVNLGIVSDFGFIKFKINNYFLELPINLAIPYLLIHHKIEILDNDFHKELTILNYHQLIKNNLLQPIYENIKLENDDDFDFTQQIQQDLIIEKNIVIETNILSIIKKNSINQSHLYDLLKNNLTKYFNLSKIDFQHSINNLLTKEYILIKNDLFYLFI